MGYEAAPRPRDLDPQNWLSRANFLVFNLQSHMINLELILQNGFRAFQHRGCVFHV